METKTTVMEAKTPLMETKTPDLEAKTADRGNKIAIVDSKPADRACHASGSRNCLTLGQAAKTRLTVNDTNHRD